MVILSSLQSHHSPQILATFLLSLSISHSASPSPLFLRAFHQQTPHTKIPILLLLRGILLNIMTMRPIQQNWPTLETWESGALLPQCCSSSNTCEPKRCPRCFTLTSISCAAPTVPPVLLPPQKQPTQLNLLAEPARTAKHGLHLTGSLVAFTFSKHSITSSWEPEPKY